MKVAAVFLLFLVAFASAQTQQPQPQPEPEPTSQPEQCSECEQIYMVTDKALYVSENGNITECAVGFCRAVAVNLDAEGVMYIADRGNLAIYRLQACGEQPEIILQNDGISNTWLFPESMALDQEGNLFIANDHEDILWTTYQDEQRRLFAREPMVYRVAMSEGDNQISSLDILAAGVAHGSRITNLKIDQEGNLWGIRENKYIVQWQDNQWSDFFGVSERFELQPYLAFLGDIAPSFQTCQKLYATDRRFGDIFAFNNETNATDAQAHCQTEENQGLDQGDNQNNETDSDQGLNQNFLLSEEHCVFVSDGVWSSKDQQSDENGQLALSFTSKTCDELIIPSRIITLCNCDVLVYDEARNRLQMYSADQQQDSGNGTSERFLGSPQPVELSFPFKVNDMAAFQPQNCSSAQPEPEPEPTAQPTAQPTGQPTAQPTQAPQPTGQPTAQPTGQPTQAPQPEPEPTGQPTQAPQPEPTATTLPTNRWF